MRRVFLAVLFLISSIVQAEPISIEQQLENFSLSPRDFMNTLPIRWGAGKSSKFSIADIQGKKFVSIKNAARAQIEKKSDFGIFSQIEGDDLPDNLVDNSGSAVKNIMDMERQGLQSARLSENPWSGYYWPLYRGQLAFRYTDRNFPENWDEIEGYLREVDNFSSVENLSPAEKYDLLFSDKENPLTKRAVAAGARYDREFGEVEHWMGICHGWAPAAFMVDRPKKTVRVLAADGKTWIPFSPSDVKALASLLWAEGTTKAKQIGGRCTTKEPETTEEGRIKDQKCFDTNPGAWHTVVVNQLGVVKRSFILDATFDYEVWNQPALSYSYKYFNPQTNQVVATLSEAMVRSVDFTRDHFKKYRSSSAASYVGIAMDFTYISETNPSSYGNDAAENDETTTVRYLYDLELNSTGKIIGGEWYQNAHPDFLWLPTANQKAVTSGDLDLVQGGLDKISWSKEKPFPKEWAAAARKSAMSGVPLSIVVENLVQLSRLP